MDGSRYQTPKCRAREGRDEVQRRWGVGGTGRIRNGTGQEEGQRQGELGGEPDSTAGGRNSQRLPQHSTEAQNPLLLSLEPQAQRLEKKAGLWTVRSYLLCS